MKRGKASSKRTVMLAVFLKAQEPSLYISNGSPQHPFGKQDRGRGGNNADAMMKLRKGRQTNQGGTSRETLLGMKAPYRKGRARVQIQTPGKLGFN